MTSKSDNRLPIGNPNNIRMGASAAQVSPESASDPGPKNPIASEQAPSSEMPPSTDRKDVPNFWFPFARAHKRIQEGGWTRQINVKDFPISTTLTGVNMRLTKGGIRELHWHSSAEWTFVIYGHARITALDQNGRGFIRDVKEGDLWYFPSGFPHSIQGIGPDGCELLLIFDDGNFSEEGTFSLSDWMAHTPPEVLGKNFGLPLSAFNHIPQRELYIFQSKEPKPLETDLQRVIGTLGISPISFSYSLYDQKPDVVNQAGEARVVDSTRFPISTTVAAALVTVHPNCMRELHWHPNADEWIYFIKGKGRITLFTAMSTARTMDFDTGDIGYMPRTMGHYIENQGDTDLCFLEIFKSSYYASISLSDWLSHVPLELVEAHTHMSREHLEAIPKKQAVIVPE